MFNINFNRNIKIVIKLLLLYLVLFYFCISNYKHNKYYIKYNKTIKRLELSKELNKIYSILYDISRFGQLETNFTNVINTKNYPINKIKGICGCIMGKNEQLYAKEFVKYYKLIGFDKLYIFDNNDINKENFETILNDYIKNKFVEIIDIKGFESVQIPIYNYCYQTNKNKYDFITFIDFDEFIFINNTKNNINEYLYNERFKKCQTILLNWKIYDDNDLEKYDDRTLLERFTRPIGDLCVVKSIVRGGINDLIIPNTHVTGININYFCNSEGERVFPKSFKNINCKTNPIAYIKHFYTKTVDEFCNKIKKSDAHFNKKNPLYKPIIFQKIENFFKINNTTKSKIKKLEKCLNLNLNKYRK